MNQVKERAGINGLDIRIALAVAVCCLTATVLNHFNLKFSFGEMKMEIIQKMTACIACLLCCQDDTKISFKAGVNRMIITAIGGAAGILAVVINNYFPNEWLLVLVVAAGILLTLFLCKAAGVPYINARIGGVTFILVALTLNGNARIVYAVFRLISTFYGVLVVLLVTWLYQKVKA